MRIKTKIIMVSIMALGAVLTTALVANAIFGMSISGIDYNAIVQSDELNTGKNPGTMTGMASDDIVNSSFVMGNRFVKALDFEGTDDHILIPNDTSIQVTDNLSAVLWVKQTVEAVDKHLFSFYLPAGNQRAWTIQTGSASALAVKAIVSDNGEYTNHNKTYETTNPVMNTGAWNQVALTFSAGTLKIYVNGAEITSVTKVVDDAITSVHASTGDLTIGAKSDVSAFLNGQIVNASLWNGAVLSATDISSLYNSGAGMNPRDLKSTNGANLIDSWLYDYKMDYPTVGDNILY